MKTIIKILIVIAIGCFLFYDFRGVGEKIAERPVFEGTDYDVIVVGGEPEGVAAAVSAGRNGMKTLLVEDDEALGGLMTLGMLNVIDMCWSRDGTLLTQGIFEEFYQAVGGNVFDVEHAKAVFLEMVENEPNIDLKLETRIIGPVVEENTILGVTLWENGEEKTYRAARVIDATIDADIAAAAGVPYTFAGEDLDDEERQMGATLVFSLRNVDWEKIETYLNNDGDPSTDTDEKSAWGYAKEAAGYQPHDPMIRLRGFNVGRQDNGDVLVNALILLGVDVLDRESREAGIARGETELEYILPYIRQNFPGFENAILVGTAERLYVRESRHIVGEYRLTIDDVLENRDQWDKIAIGAYPVDVQPTIAQLHGTVIGNPDRYAIPFRSLVPVAIDDLLVVGRAASYTSLAAGSARVIPIGMAEGEAAGVATAYSVTHGVSYREMTTNETAIQTVQEQLRKQGAYLEDFTITDDVMNHWAYPGVKVLRSLGLLEGGYHNNYRLEEPMNKWRFQNMVNKSMAKAGIVLDFPLEVSVNPTNEEIIAVVCSVLGVSQEDYAGNLAQLENIGLLDEQLSPYFMDSMKNPQAAEVIMLVANLYEYVKK